MDVRVVYNKRQAKCYYCNDVIKLKDLMLITRYWSREEVGKKRWPLKNYFHPQCWIDHHRYLLDKNPQVETRGSKGLGLSSEIMAKRMKLLRSRASIVQRIKTAAKKLRKEKGETEEVKNGEVQRTGGYNLERIIALGEQLNILKEQIEPLGGVPKSWE